MEVTAADVAIGLVMFLQAAFWFSLGRMLNRQDRIEESAHKNELQNTQEHGEFIRRPELEAHKEAVANSLKATANRQDARIDGLSGQLSDRRQAP